MVLVISAEGDSEAYVQVRLKTDRRTAGVPVVELADLPMPNRPGSCDTLFADDEPSTVPQ
jgi:hypothetical protein